MHTAKETDDRYLVKMSEPDSGIAAGQYGVFMKMTDVWAAVSSPIRLKSLSSFL